MELPLSPGGRRYGYKRDPADFRDRGGMRLSIAGPVALPPSVDLEKWCGPVKDQGSLGACTAFAGCGMREFLARKYEVTVYHAPPVLSPLFLYYKERELDGVLGRGDTGSYGRTSVRAMNQFGVCLESEDAYTPLDFGRAPTQFQLDEALNYKAGAYHRLTSVDDMKACLASGYVFVIGFTVFESFETIGPNGRWDPDSRRERVLGGHEVLVHGYDDTIGTVVVGQEWAPYHGAFKVRNSWSASWGYGGNFTLKYSDMADSRILQDGWMQHLGHKW